MNRSSAGVFFLIFMVAVLVFAATMYSRRPVQYVAVIPVVSPTISLPFATPTEEATPSVTAVPTRRFRPTITNFLVTPTPSI